MQKIVYEIEIKWISMHNIYAFLKLSFCRLPAFQVPAAIDVLTLGDFPRLPVCITVTSNIFLLLVFFVLTSY